MVIQRKAIALIQKGKDLLICSFELSNADDDLDFMETARFHFEERVSEPERHADYCYVDYFQNSEEEDFRLIDITQVQ